MARRSRSQSRQGHSARTMPHQSQNLGLHGYFGHTAFDIDTQAVRETHSRAYLEHRLRQVDAWLAYLVEHVASHDVTSSRLQDPAAQEQRIASEVMDFAYLQAVRRAIYETLKAF